MALIQSKLIKNKLLIKIIIIGIELLKAHVKVPAIIKFMSFTFNPIFRVSTIH